MGHFHFSIVMLCVLFSCASPALHREEPELGQKKGPNSANLMVRIPGGTFLLGSSDGSSNEKPVTQVSLSPYWMDRTEVSVAEYRKCVEAASCRAANSVEWPEIKDEERLNWSRFCNFDKDGSDEHPMNCVDWGQASRFCAWRQARLPTEAEWEFAAKGPKGNKYPWGDEKPGPELARWRSLDGSVPVGSFPKGQSPFGLQDMAGNVWEWVQDWKGSYLGGEVKNPIGPPSGVDKVIRGGGWYNHNPANLRSAYRSRLPPTARLHFVGFRCARDEEH